MWIILGPNYAAKYLELMTDYQGRVTDDNLFIMFSLQTRCMYVAN